MGKCPKCAGFLFSNQPGEASGYRFKLNFITCSSCSTVVGVMPHYDPGHYGFENEKKLIELAAKIQRLESLVASLRSR